jgi:putative N-acetylmannosamine-6-phosphate epimerase/predicted NBD/HSP70 family sugar kinase
VTLEALLAAWREAPLVASVQAGEDSPLADEETLLQLARASLQSGVKVLRLQGAGAIRHIRAATGAPTIALVKRHYEDSPVYITPTMREVEELLATDAEAIGLDATLRPRPGDALLANLLERVKRAGRLAMADCDTLEAALEAERLGFDFVGTTLAGYTENRARSAGPDLELLREMVDRLGIPVVAEGRYSERWQVQAAMRIGAKAVVMGAALNDTPALTNRFLAAATVAEGTVAAFDIGGTWLRFGLFSDQWELLRSERIPVPSGREARLEWMRERASESGAGRCGVGSGGVVSPGGKVTRAKPILPNHEGTEFSERTLGLPTVALNDGLATAWGHACHPIGAGKRVATLALGTGVGFGIVDRGRLWMSPEGEPPHLNDQPWAGGGTIEEALGGDGLGEARDRGAALEAARQAVRTVRTLFFPDEIVVCGGVGLSDWLDLGLPKSPFGPDAGLFGAAALALWPPDLSG